MQKWSSNTIRLDGSVVDFSPRGMKESMLDYFRKTYAQFGAMAEVATPAANWRRADPLRHPWSWYFGHTACFYVNKLRTAKVIEKPFNPAFEAMFAVGVDEMSWDDKLEDREWPDFDTVLEYRRQVGEYIEDVIESMPPPSLPVNWDDHPWWAVIMGCEHERIHLETSTALLRQLPVDVLQPHDYWDNVCQAGSYAVGESPVNQIAEVDATNVSVGRSVQGTQLYGWDNEFGQADFEVPAFGASTHLVSNEEYYEFVMDKGYERPEFWSDEGKLWLQQTQRRLPKFWIETNQRDKFDYRHLTTIGPLPWNFPAVTNNLEAEAFCRWKSAQTGRELRLPTECEYAALRNTADIGDQPDWHGQAPGNINMQYWQSECPVDMFQQTPDFYDVVGNVWHHTITPQYPFRGFQVHPLYDDFTVPVFGPHHANLKGGAWASTGCVASRHGRYQFRRHFYQHAGIRYVESDRNLGFVSSQKQQLPSDHRYIQEYINFHYCDEPKFGVENFPKKVADIAMEFVPADRRGQALDVGCNVGRTTFELGKYFDRAVGVDYTARIIGTPLRFQELGIMDSQVPVEGDCVNHKNYSLKGLGLEDAATRCDFYQGDAHNLHESHKDYDLVVASNLIDRLFNPTQFLSYVHERMNGPGSILVLLSPYSWSDEYTPREKWIGGFYDLKQQPISSQLLVDGMLEERFEKLDERDVPFVIQETARKHQHTLSTCTVWRLK